MTRPMMVGRRAALFGTVALATPAARGQSRAGLRDLAREAAIYLTPLAAMYARRFRDTVEADHKLNRLVREQAPQDGLLSATAWLDLSNEPLFLALPAMAGRFYSAALLDPFTDNFAHVSSRLSGDRPPPHMIAGPTWSGTAPGDVTLIRATANAVWLRLHIAVADDLEAARTLQAACLLETPDQRNERRIIEMRELMRYRSSPPPEPIADWPAPRPGEPFDLFDTGLAMLGGCSLSEADKALLEELAPLHLRPGRRFDARAFSDAERGAIIAGIADAVLEIREQGPRLGRTAGDWRYPAPNLGAFGTDYLYRAWIATMAQGAALGAAVPAEMLELSRISDGSSVRFLAPAPELLTALQ
jgi:hypothetical protein